MYTFQSVSQPTDVLWVLKRTKPLDSGSSKPKSSQWDVPGHPALTFDVSHHLSLRSDVNNDSAEQLQKILEASRCLQNALKNKRCFHLCSRERLTSVSVRQNQEDGEIKGTRGKSQKESEGGTRLESPPTHTYTNQQHPLYQTPLTSFSPSVLWCYSPDGGSCTLYRSHHVSIFPLDPVWFYSRFFCITDSDLLQPAVRTCRRPVWPQSRQVPSLTLFSRL